jgi:predicted dehydrogenase
MPQVARRRLRLGMVGGGRGAFIGAVHRTAARLHDRYRLVAGALSSDPDRARLSGADLMLDPERCYGDVEAMIRRERQRDDPMQVVAIVTPNHQHYAAARACLLGGFHVICDKPLATDPADAQELCRIADGEGRVLAVTYNYSGYSLVRTAREWVRAGRLGRVHQVQVEYLQDWLLEALEASGHKQASWRTDPDRSGPGGCVADVGSHAFHLAEFVSGLRVGELSAELSTLVPDRRLDDDARVRLRFEGGARGSLWASQVATGHQNSVRLQVYGDRGSLEWRHEAPNELRVFTVGEPPRTVTSGGARTGAEGLRASGLPPGHPEGYLEAFGQVYWDIAELITAHCAVAAPPIPRRKSLAPAGHEGLRGVRFIAAAVESSRQQAAWRAL